MKAKAKRAKRRVDPLVGLLLRWFYGYHRAVEAHLKDDGDKDIKPWFLDVYLETHDVLGKMRDSGSVTDAQCGVAYDRVCGREVLKIKRGKTSVTKRDNVPFWYNYELILCPKVTK